MGRILRSMAACVGFRNAVKKMKRQNTVNLGNIYLSNQFNLGNLWLKIDQSK
jgi:hypothetical protein